MLPQLVPSFDASNRAQFVASWWETSAPVGTLSGSIYIEPNVWQLICIPTRFGYWSVGIDITDYFTDSDTTYLTNHTADTGEGWTDIDGGANPFRIYSNKVLNFGSTVQQMMDNTSISPGVTITIECVIYIVSPNAGDMKWFGLVDVNNSATVAYGCKLVQNKIDMQSHAYSTTFSGNEVAHTEVALTEHTYRIVFDTSAATWTYQISIDGTSATSGSFIPSTSGPWRVGLATSSTQAHYLEITANATNSLISDSTTVARFKNYILDQLEDKYGSSVVTVANTYFGDDNFFRNYVPDVTPDDSINNFPLALEDPVSSGNYEYTAMWIKSNHNAVMELEWEADV